MQAPPGPPPLTRASPSDGRTPSSTRRSPGDTPAFGPLVLPPDSPHPHVGRRLTGAPHPGDDRALRTAARLQSPPRISGATHRGPHQRPLPQRLKAGYLFPEIGRRVRAFQEAHPDRDLIKLGIGDVTEPLPASVRQALHAAVDELGVRETFRGYGPEKGYAVFAGGYRRTTISRAWGCRRTKSIFPTGPSATAATCWTFWPPKRREPGGRRGPGLPCLRRHERDGRQRRCGRRSDGRYAGLIYLEATAENDFQPAVPDEDADVVYLCYPNNPTGAVASKALS